MNGIDPLLAGADDLIGIVVFLVIIIISAISQVVGKAKEAQQRQRPRPPVRPAGPPRRVPNPRDPLAREVDDFLRRAGAGGKGPAPARPAAAPAVPVARPVGRAVVDDVIEQLEEVDAGVSVAEHVEHSVGHLERPQVGQALGLGVSQAERKLVDQVSQDFDHQVGRLSAEDEPISGPLPQTAATDLAAMLASPVDLRRAILITEVLRRPEHRWT